MPADQTSESQRAFVNGTRGTTDPSDLPRRCCELVAEGFCLRLTEPRAWLNQIAERLANLLGPNTACWMSDAALDQEGTGWIGNVFAPGTWDGNELFTLASSETRSGFPLGDAPGCPLRAFTVPGAACIDRAGIYSDSDWQASRYRVVCERAGVHDFVRGAHLVGPPGSRRWLVAEVQGLEPDWSVGPTICEPLAAVMPGIARAYDQRFLRRERVRQELADRVRPAQRETLVYWAEGLSEPEIARKVFRSVHTVHDHVKRIYGRWRFPTGSSCVTCGWGMPTRRSSRSDDAEVRGGVKAFAASPYSRG
ncbi:MAG: helix-turn-helix transcriptional regulator [Phycisphaerales bacterium]